MAQDIKEFITTEKISYETLGVPVVDQFEWQMYKHIQLCTLYKDGKLSTGNADDKPVKNIILPIVNVAYRTEGFDVKDIVPFVNDEKNYYKSFLVKKFHDKYALDNDIDTFIDDVVESYVDYGGAFVREDGKRPRLIPLQSIAFCDQTDLIGAPFGIKHMYTPDGLLDMVSQGWDESKIRTCIELSDKDKDVQQAQGRKAKTPGKYIEVYEVHGVLPTSWLIDGKDLNDEKDYTRQVQIVALIKNDNGNDEAHVLYKGKEKKGLFKLLKRDKRFGTALGRSAIEELFEPQVWTNYSMIQIKKMLDAAALMILQTSDPLVAQRNKVKDLQKGEIIVHAENMPISQVTIQPQNMQAFENAVVEWENHARVTGSANDAALGINPSAGTPFKLQELLTQQGLGMHEYRQGKIAVFMSEIYRDWILPDMVKTMNQGQSFISELSLEELKEVADKVIANHTNDIIKKRILEGGLVQPGEVEYLTEKSKAEFMKHGNKRFIKILKDELKTIPIDVEINIVGKQKDLNAMTDKLTNIFRQVIASPQVLQDPNAANIFNQILEAAGLTPINFVPVKPPEQNVPSPIQDINKLADNKKTNG